PEKKATRRRGGSGKAKTTDAPVAVAETPKAEETTKVEAATEVETAPDASTPEVAATPEVETPTAESDTNDTTEEKA
ncbi:MAG: hypothetical protein H7Y07_17480, partial [Pyrinomonadaceae bacterium]|nr:hypothetical protein [Sphingobacteriaceae bacterium]